MQTEIYNHGPVSASMTVYEDFVDYKKGIYSHVSGSNQGVISVRVLGWDVD